MIHSLVNQGLLGLIPLFVLVTVGCLNETDATFSSASSDTVSSVKVQTDPLGVGLLLGDEDIARDFENRSPAPTVRSVPHRLGTRFDSPSTRWRFAPDFIEIEIPDIPHKYAIWGATGRDDFGNLYFGVSARGEWEDSAALCLVRPKRIDSAALGDAVGNLQRLGLAHRSTMQMKIHSKPVQAQDGYIYFASMDEYGETEDGTRLPFYGSNLWRLRVDDRGEETKPQSWEHLLALPEGIIATGCTGRYVYALGYYEHSLYQFDTQSFGVKKVKVGSPGGHVSRNLIVDLNEHVYVPRVVQRNVGDYVVHLIEFDHEMREVGSHQLEDYGATSDFSSHGIVGFAFLKNGDCVFTTSTGALYRLKPSDNAPSSLERLGWFHPGGQSYASVLYAPDGESTVCGLARREQAFEWVVYDLDQWRGDVVPLSESAKQILGRESVLAYGTNTRDSDGDALIVGWYKGSESDRHLPYAARVRWPQP